MVLIRRLVSELLRDDTVQGMFDDPFTSETTSCSSSPIPSVDDTTSTPRLERNCSYFKSLLLLSQRDKNSVVKLDNGHHEKSAAHSQEVSSGNRYVRYNRDRTICWRQSKQPFFGIERIPVTPVSPLQKHCPWNDLSRQDPRQNPSPEPPTSRHIDQVKIKVNPLDRNNSSAVKSSSKKLDTPYKSPNKSSESPLRFSKKRTSSIMNIQFEPKTSPVRLMRWENQPIREHYSCHVTQTSQSESSSNPSNLPYDWCAERLGVLLFLASNACFLTVKCFAVQCNCFRCGQFEL